MAAVVNWRKSRRSIAMGECVELAPDDHGLIVRDSKDPAGPVLAFSVEAWRTFTGELQAA